MGSEPGRDGAAVRRRPRVLAVGLLCLGAILAGGLAAGVVPALRTATAAQGAARRALEEARRAASSADAGRAARALRQAAASAHRAETALSRPALRVAGLVPVLGRPFRTARSLAQAAAAAAQAGQLAVQALPSQPLVSGGVVDLARLRRLRGAAERAERHLREARRRVAASPGWPLPGALRAARHELGGRLQEAERDVGRAAQALGLLEEVVGRGPRRYFVLLTNPTELRGTGGFWGAYAVVESDAGRLRLTRVGHPGRDLHPTAWDPGPPWYQARFGTHYRAHTLWEDLAFTPDFPTVAAMAEANLARTPGVGPVDGVIAVDLPATEPLLRLTGPLRVAGWPVPLGAGNVVQVALHDAYVAYDGDVPGRRGFLGELTAAMWQALLGGELTLRPEVVADLGRAVRARRIQVHLARPAEQAVVARLGADGSIGDRRHTFGAVTMNFSLNKLDWWLRRRFELSVQLRKDGSALASVRGTFFNDAPSSGEPRYMIGPNRPWLRAGLMWLYATYYLPAGAEVLPPRPQYVEEENGFQAAAHLLEIPGGEATTLQVSALLPRFWDPRTGRVTVVWRRQAALRPDFVRLVVKPPPGWRVAHSAVNGAPARRAGWTGATETDVEVQLRLKLA